MSDQLWIELAEGDPLLLQAPAGLEPAPTLASSLIGERINGGWRIKTNDAGTHYVDVLEMIYNYRVALSAVHCPDIYVRYWCYAGEDRLAVLLRAVAAARIWDGDPDTEPLGWNKNGQTKEWREPE